jgi:hypothetical protein
VPAQFLDFHPLLRIAGRDPTAAEVLTQTLAREDFPIHGITADADAHNPYPYQIDLALEVALDTSGDSQPPSPGVTYAGLTPAQRGAFLDWSLDPTRPAPAAFQRLFIAHVEVGLLDPDAPHQKLHRELIRLAYAPAWRRNEWHARALLLALWLTSNGAGIAEWTSAVDVSPVLLELAIGLQALLHEELRVEQIARLAAIWNVAGADIRAHVLETRLKSLTDSLGQPLLQAVREALDAQMLQPRPWRTAHRSLRFSIPQPDIEPLLRPLLVEMLALTGEDPAPADAGLEPGGPASQDPGWQLVLEFGHSRSDFYEHVLHLAQRMPGYLQLMDEDRRLVHRVSMRKSELRRFWRIWDYVQNWSSTRVYLNGEELEHWKIWPYSQYLR